MKDILELPDLGNETFASPSQKLAYYMLKKSNNVREGLLNEAERYNTKEEQLKFICDIMVNAYTYDYSVVFQKTKDGFIDESKFWQRCFSIDGKTFSTASLKMIYPSTRYKNISLSPSVHAIRMGTCATFSAEIAWFCEELGIPYSRKKDLLDCFDNLNTPNAIVPVTHEWVEIELDGKKKKIDIAGAIMAKDLKSKYPNFNINSDEFLLGEVNTTNPFAIIREEFNNQLAKMTGM